MGSQKRILNLLFTGFLALSVVACTQKKDFSIQDERDEAPVVEVDTDAVPPDALEDVASDAEKTQPQEEAKEVAEAPVSDRSESDPAPFPAPAPAFKGTGEYESYTVRAGDTLMKIAFEQYGDLYQWKKIYDLNKDQLTGVSISAGTVLKVERSDFSFTISRNGEKYLIKRGDTLGTISNDVYGTKTRWRDLWDNNKQLIKDPNKIYAGFTLYYTLDPSQKLTRTGKSERTPGAASEPTPSANDESNDGF